ncbi:carboxylating nicotinate-nucleotide diphosphorylase [Hippea maritima]|uniref:Probable nicotinate-nucleotide pyrophosphorylase [carboxylating] n=1 Tax=Hippea maritima (strain ATCC 700847 / DSM 10411 / MH2) TaxID=760142 RepID=F2LU48_HIPMA|nr:carboxylating nicotinate-nucleotide diphosphorylase [Hippea maritima]AEA34511.1 nicotinate-nucleotide pyrophosphorylase [Hippea maritima DSM 10411]
MNPVFIEKSLKAFLLEDAYFSDITTESLSQNKKAKAIIKAKEDFILAGAVFLNSLFKLMENDFKISLFKQDGELVKKGECIAEVESTDRAILYIERTCLNLLQRLSGIATKARKFAQLLEPYKAKITDTRKTTPGLRFFEKYAVKIGGGVNHRMGLFDAVLIKDNHIKAVGSIKRAIELARRNVSFTTKIEIECSDLEQVRQAIEAKADIVMLDNMSIGQMKEALNLFKGEAIFEASGNITEENVQDVAKTGIDFISSGSIIHHACWVDINMKLE